jgi:hypothetical protein
MKNYRFLFLLFLTAAPMAAHADSSAFEEGVSDYFAMVRQTQSEQPLLASPVISTNPELEERYRTDTSFEKAGNGSHIIAIDGGKGLDLIVTPTEEIQIALPSYTIKQPAKDQPTQTGFNDWAFFRFKQRLLSAPAGEGNYVLSTWMQVQAPTGVSRYTNNSWTLVPTIGGAKVWGDIGAQVTNNFVVQYHIARFFWPELEANWTYFPDGPRGGKHQVYLTPGIIVGRIPLGDPFKLTVALGYQTAVAPHYQASPLLPAYNSGWVISTRVSF